MLVVLGGNGYVGSAIRKALELRNLPFATVTRATVDYFNPAALAGILRDMHPEFLINAAGYTGRPNVDACEVHRTECLLGNAALPGILRRVCEDLSLPWGHISSGCIFTGSRPDGGGFTESDPPNFSFRQNNCSFYSGCKALGEEMLAGAELCHVWRLRIPFNSDDGPRNYISKMMRYDRLLMARNSLSQLDEFAAACVDCWLQRLPFGLWNLTNPGSVTTADVVDLIRRFGLIRKDFQFFESENEFQSKAAVAPRSNCVLDSSKAVAAGLRLTPIHAALEHAMRNWRPAAGT